MPRRRPASTPRHQLHVLGRGLEDEAVAQSAREPSPVPCKACGKPVLLGTGERRISYDVLVFPACYANKTRGPNLHNRSLPLCVKIRGGPKYCPTTNLASKCFAVQMECSTQRMNSPSNSLCSSGWTMLTCRLVCPQMTF